MSKREHFNDRARDMQSATTKVGLGFRALGLMLAKIASHSPCVEKPGAEKRVTGAFFFALRVPSSYNTKIRESPNGGLPQTADKLKSAVYFYIENWKKEQKYGIMKA